MKTFNPFRSISLCLAAVAVFTAAGLAQNLTVRQIMAEPSIAGQRVSGEKLSPDGERVAFFWNADGKMPRDLYIVPTDGSRAPEKILTPTALPTPSPSPTPDNKLDYGIELNDEWVLERRNQIGSVEWSPDSTKLVFTHSGDLYIFKLGDTAPKRITRTQAPEVAARFLDNDRILYMQGGHVFVLNTADATLVQVSKEANPGQYRSVGGVTPNKSGSLVAYIVSDSSKQRALIVPNYLPEYATTSSFRRGWTEQKLYVMRTDGSRYEPFEIKLPKPEGVSSFRRMAWAADGRSLIVDRLDKDTKRRQLFYVHNDGGKSEKIILITEETDEKWQAPLSSIFEPHPTDPNKLFFASERDGYNHLYLATLKLSAPEEPEPQAETRPVGRVPRAETRPLGIVPQAETRPVGSVPRAETRPLGSVLSSTLRDSASLREASYTQAPLSDFASLRETSSPKPHTRESVTIEQLTRGPWQVEWAKWLEGSDEIVFLSTREGYTEREFSSILLNDLSPLNIEGANETGMRGSAQMSEGSDARLLYEFSQWNSPGELRVVRVCTRCRGLQFPRTLTATTPEAFTKLSWAEPKFIEIHSRDGKKIPAKIYLPPGHNPRSRTKYPMVIFVHGAGYLQNVINGWNNYYREFMFNDLLAKRGYVVLDIDYRGSAGYGRDWRTDVHDFLGGKDFDDHIDSIDHMVANYAVDQKRIGAYGGSYGGFMAGMLAMRAPERIAAAAALRPVFDWKNYFAANPFYTAQRLGFPDKNPEAYRRSSPISYADKLERPLLILHGMADSNVHVQDSVQLMEKLIRLGKTQYFEVMLYPSENHGFERPESWADEYERILAFFEKHLEKALK